MVDIQVQEFKVKLKGQEYTFRLDFEALLKFMEKYSTKEDPEYGVEIFNEFLQGKNTYRNIIKILSCACVEKDWTEKELRKSIPFSFRSMKLMDGITNALIWGVLSDEPEGQGKNG